MARLILFIDAASGLRFKLIAKQRSLIAAAIRQDDINHYKNFCHGFLRYLPKEAPGRVAVPRLL